VIERKHIDCTTSEPRDVATIERTLITELPRRVKVRDMGLYGLL